MTDAHPEGHGPRQHLSTLVLGALGVVYGDIGTSPLYAMRECFHGPYAVPPIPTNILGARVSWKPGAEAEIIEALHHREVDVLAAGLDSKTPYKAELGLTQPYVEVEDRYGSKKKHVLAVTPGESALLFSLDQFLAARDKAGLRRRAQQMQQERAHP